MPSLTKKHKNQLEKMYEKFCERHELNSKDPNIKKAFRRGYSTGHRVARVTALRESIER